MNMHLAKLESWVIIMSEQYSDKAVSARVMQKGMNITVASIKAGSDMFNKVDLNYNTFELVYCQM